MFLAEDVDTANLRQGDVLRGIPFPLLQNAKTDVLGVVSTNYEFASVPPIEPRTHEHREDPDWVTIQVPARFCFCAVLSHCCDIAIRTGGRPQTPVISLARVRPIPPNIRHDPARFESLRANRDPRDADNPGYIDYFYLEPHANLMNQDWMVHYSQAVTLPATDYELLLAKKILQLDDRSRMKFKIKLAFSFGRATNEEIGAGLENPWA